MKKKRPKGYTRKKKKAVVRRFGVRRSQRYEAGKLVKLGQLKNLLQGRTGLPFLKIKKHKTIHAQPVFSKSQRALFSVLRRKKRKLVRCFEHFYRRHRTMGVKIVFEIVVDRKGRAKRSEVLSEQPRYPGMSRCMIRHIRSLRFPKQKDAPVVLDLPFMFLSP